MLSIESWETGELRSELSAHSLSLDAIRPPVETSHCIAALSAINHWASG